MRTFFTRVGIKITSTKAMAFVVIVAALTLKNFEGANAEIMKFLVASMFGANAIQHVAQSLKKDKTNGA